MDYIKGFVFISEDKIECERFSSFYGEGIAYLSSTDYIVWTHRKNHNEINPVNVWESKKYSFTIRIDDATFIFEHNPIPSALSYTKDIITSAVNKYMNIINSKKGADMNIKQFKDIKTKAKQKGTLLTDAYKLKDDIAHSYLYYDEVEEWIDSDWKWFNDYCKKYNIKFEDLGDKYLLTGERKPLQSMFNIIGFNYYDCIFDSVKGDKDSIKDAIKVEFIGVMIEFCECTGRHPTISSNMNKVFTNLNDINNILEKEDRVAYNYYQEHGYQGGGYDKVFFTWIFNINGERYSINGGRVDLGDGVRHGKDHITLTNQDIEYMKNKILSGNGNRFNGGIKKLDSIKAKDWLDDTERTVVEDAIYWVKRDGKPLTISNVIAQINEDNSGFLGGNKDRIIDYLKKEKHLQDSKKARDLEVDPNWDKKELVVNEKDKEFFENVYPQIVEAFVKHYGRKPNDDELKAIRSMAHTGTGFAKVIRTIYGKDSIKDAEGYFPHQLNESNVENIKVGTIFKRYYAPSSISCGFIWYSKVEKITGNILACRTIKRDRVWNNGTIEEDKNPPRDIYYIDKYDMARNNAYPTAIVSDSIKDVKPKANESKTDFIARFMNETEKEYPNEKQRYAVANSYWKNKGKDSKVKDSEFEWEGMWINGALRDFDARRLVEATKQRGSLHSNRFTTWTDTKRIIYCIVVHPFFTKNDIMLDIIRQTFTKNGDKWDEKQDRIFLENATDVDDAVRKLEQFTRSIHDSVKDSIGRVFNVADKSIKVSDDDNKIYIVFKKDTNTENIISEMGSFDNYTDALRESNRLNKENKETNTYYTVSSRLITDSVKDSMESEVKQWWNEVEQWNRENGNKFDINNDGASAEDMLIAMVDMIPDLKGADNRLYNNGKRIYNKYSKYSQYRDSVKDSYEAFIIHNAHEVDKLDADQRNISVDELFLQKRLPSLRPFHITKLSSSGEYGYGQFKIEGSFRDLKDLIWKDPQFYTSIYYTNDPNTPIRIGH